MTDSKNNYIFPTWAWLCIAVVFLISTWYIGSSIYRARTVTIQTPSDVQSYLQGVWTFTKPTDLDKPPHGWERWTFSTSTVTIQSAVPSDTTWSGPSKYSYEVTRKKTADTGDWYWHVRVKETQVNAAFFDKGKRLVAFWGGSNYTLSKEDRDLSK